jgi:hypothetical protein
MIFLFITSGLALISFVYLLVDYKGQAEIEPKSGFYFKMPCLRARDLIVQEFDNEGNLWATRGMLVYRMSHGEGRFHKIARVPSGFSLFWLNNFRFIRMITLRSECVELIIGHDGSLCAFSSGRMWNSDGIGKPFQLSFRLPNFGIKTGRGIMSTALLKTDNQRILFGEYFNNPERKSVKIYEYAKEVNHWGIAYEFHPGTIRHIHALQADCYSSNLWVCTGDEDKEPMIGISDDGLRTITPVGQGSQKWRACQLVFTEKAVYWGADTGSEEFGGIYRWARDTRSCEKLISVHGAVFFGTRLSNGIIVMSTDREGFPNEKDKKTRLFFLDNGDEIASLECGTWNNDKHGFRFNFAKLRLQRNQGSKALAVSCLNLKEIPEGDLLIFSEEDIKKCYLSHC